jgi:hypothetical protein
MTLPLLYISTRVEEIGISIIHVKAEQEILEIQSKTLALKTSVLNRQMFDVDIDSLPKAKRRQVMDSVFASKKLVSITPDSASKELDRLEKLRDANLILIVRLSEKGEVIQAQLKSIRFYLWYACFYLVVGAVMSVLGFGMWYKKEYPNGIKFTLRSPKVIEHEPSTSAPEAAPEPPGEH